MTSKPFPLLRLPSLAQDKISKNTELTELYHLSKLSTRSKYIVKRATHKCSYSLSFFFDKISYYQLEKNRDFLRVNESSISKLESDINHFMEVFNNPKFSIFLWGNASVIPLIFELVSRQNLKIENVSIDSKNPSLEEYKIALELGSLSKQFRFHSGVPADFQNLQEPENLPVFKCDSILIRSSKWVTVSHLVHNFMNCKSVELGNCLIDFRTLHPLLEKLTKQETQMNSLILRKKIEKVETFSFQELLKDIPAIQVNHVRVGTYKVYTVGYIITMGNGKDAVICTDAESFVISTDFRVLQ